jgi:hypothetical protein
MQDKILHNKQTTNYMSIWQFNLHNKLTAKCIWIGNTLNMLKRIMATHFGWRPTGWEPLICTFHSTVTAIVSYRFHVFYITKVFGEIVWIRLGAVSDCVLCAWQWLQPATCVLCASQWLQPATCFLCLTNNYSQLPVFWATLGTSLPQNMFPCLSVRLSVSSSTFCVFRNQFSRYFSP